MVMKIEPKSQPTPEEIDAIQEDEDKALAEYVGIARAQLLTITNNNGRNIAAWQDSIKQLQGQIDKATVESNKAQKAINAMDRIVPAVLPSREVG